MDSNTLTFIIGYGSCIIVMVLIAIWDYHSQKPKKRNPTVETYSRRIYHIHFQIRAEDYEEYSAYRDVVMHDVERICKNMDIPAKVKLDLTSWEFGLMDIEVTCSSKSQFSDVYSRITTDCARLIGKPAWYEESLTKNTR